MKVSGFTFIRNALKYDYPIVEAIQSILPICDEIIVAVGNSEDETRQLIENIRSDKIKIIDTIWDDSLRKGGRVLAAETDKALKAISEDSDWCFYIQGDEVLHEKFHEPVLESMQKWKDDERVEGLVFNYGHFYGSYDFLGDSRGWYQREVRIVRKDPKIYSFRDAQGFQKDGRPLNVKVSGGTIYHYGWVKHPKYQQQKQMNFNKFWHDDLWMEKNVEKVDEFDYSQIDSLKEFEGTHPLVMKERIEKINWKFNFDPTKKNMSLKNRFHHALKKYFGISIGEYRNFRLIK
jgi:glycosyltransferase involved in cell wall biosynthesis